MKIHVIITMIALVVFLIAAIWYAKKKYKINLSVLGLGAVAFFVSSQVLEKIFSVRLRFMVILNTCMFE